jgi:hypothetical protein
VEKIWIALNEGLAMRHWAVGAGALGVRCRKVGRTHVPCRIYPLPRRLVQLDDL